MKDRKKRLLPAILLVICAVLAGVIGFRFLAVHTVADYLPAEQPTVLQVWELKKSGTRFEERQTQDAKALYRVLCETTVRRRWASQNQFSGEARYTVYADYSAAGSYHIVYYPAVAALEIYRDTERIYAADVIGTQLLAQLLPGIPEG